MAYKHGIYGREVATSLVPMTQINAGLPVVFGTAPVHLATDPAKANTPVLCYKYAEAVSYLGYSTDWENFTLCEFMKSQFSLFGMAPVVFVNVLDVKKHITTMASTAYTPEKGVVTLSKSEMVLLDTLNVSAVSDGSTSLRKGIDYTAAYNDSEQLVITILEPAGVAEGESVYIAYTKIDPSKVTYSDIVGGVDVTTGEYTGLEVIAQVYPKLGLIPGLIVAPGWSDNSEVAAVMVAKSTGINARFKAIALADIDTKTVTKYSDVKEWKSQNNYNDPQLVACWPKISLSGTQYHFSTQLAGVICATDADNNDIPYKSPSNESIQGDATVTDDGTEVLLDVETGAYLNSQGIVTAINENGWVAWGNRTTCYPGNTDVKDAFIPIRRMFCYINNTLITTFWSKIDDPLNKRLISTIVDSANIWLNGLTAKQYLLGGRVEFREDENTTTDLMDGIINFHVYFTPPSPARDIEFVQEYDTDYVKTLFE
jgi:uncharacterized protein